MEDLNAQAQTLADQESFDNWVMVNDGNKSKVAVDLIGDIFGRDRAGEYLIDDETKMEQISKVVGFYWGMA
jgi:hypothetical protein